MKSSGKVILVSLIIVGGALVSSDWRAVAAAAACPAGYYSPDGTGWCMKRGDVNCGMHTSCPPGSTCGANHTCSGPPPKGPSCGSYTCSAAGYLCGTAGGIQGCYNPRTQYLQGGKVCYWVRSYPAGDPCARPGQNREAATKRQTPEALKDAVADKPAADRVLSHYMHGIKVVPALKVDDDWTCPKSYPLRQLDTYHGYLCRPAGTIHCSFSSRSYACLTGYACHNNPTGTGHSNEECRK